MHIAQPREQAFRAQALRPGMPSGAAKPLDCLPAWGYNFAARTRRAVSSAGERLLHTQEVAGSNPAPPTTEVFAKPGRSGGMADALRSGRSARMGVWVQIPPSAPLKMG
jgi:hypothetical protein